MSTLRAGAQRGGADRLCQGQPGPAELRLLRHRGGEPPVPGTVPRPGGDRGGARALPRRRAGADRPAGRPHPGDVPGGAGGDPGDARRARRGPSPSPSGIASRCCRRCRRSRRRCPASTRCSGRGSSRRSARRRRCVARLGRGAAARRPTTRTLRARMAEQGVASRPGDAAMLAPRAGRGDGDVGPADPGGRNQGGIATARPAPRRRPGRHPPRRGRGASAATARGRRAVLADRQRRRRRRRCRRHGRRHRRAAGAAASGSRSPLGTPAACMAACTRPRVAASGSSDGVDAPGAGRALGHLRRLRTVAGERRLVPGGGARAGRQLPLQQRQLGQQDGRLDACPAGRSCRCAAPRSGSCPRHGCAASGTARRGRRRR